MLGRGEIPMAINSMEDDLVHREMATIHIGEGAGEISESPQLDETAVDVLVHPDGKTAVEWALDGGPALSRQ